MSTEPQIKPQTETIAKPYPKRKENSLPYKFKSMVGWYDPSMLFRIAVQTVVSALFGERSDFRMLESYEQASSKIYFDYSVQYKQDETGRLLTDEEGFYIPDQERPRDEIWIDYVSDTGDGWNPTYSVAYHVAQERMLLTDSEGKTHVTPRGDILLFGGDQVYPAPDKGEYENRLIRPYGAALPHAPETKPRVFAIPGNHDWYDSLVGFTRIFCTNPSFNEWKAPQHRSYFALKLPHGWWLLGTDVQLDSDLDLKQVEYFKKVCDEMEDGDRVILANAESYWVDEKMYAKYDDDYLESNLDYLQRELIGKKVQVFLAGNQHHYRRFEYCPLKEDGTPDDSQKVEKITAGGGGAFLHPTHEICFDSVEDTFSDGTKRTYQHVASYPDVETSKKLTLGNFGFLAKNKTFGLFTGFMYLMTAWLLLAPIGTYGLSQFEEAVWSVVQSTLATPEGGLWVAFFLVSFCMFTDTHSKVYKFFAGTIHALSNLTTLFFISWGAVYLCVSVLGADSTWFQFMSISQLALSGALIFLGGFLAGPTIMGIYLYVSLNVFGRHYNEAFSSMQIQDYRNFLRLHIDIAGNLTIYPVGIERVPRKWKERPAGATGSLFLPDDPNATLPQLIEDPIVVLHSDESKPEQSRPEDELARQLVDAG